MSPREVSLDTIELRADSVTRETIDVNDGIERVMGNRELYARMLRRFRRDYQHGSLPMRTALSANDTELAHRLHARASALEEVLRTGASGVRETLASLTPEFDKVLHLLDILLDGSPPSGMPVHLSARALLGDAALLEQLAELLSKADGAALDLLEDASASLHVILGEDKLRRVTEAAARFDFAEALSALGEADAGQGI